MAEFTALVWVSAIRGDLQTNITATRRVFSALYGFLKKHGYFCVSHDAMQYNCLAYGY